MGDLNCQLQRNIPERTGKWSMTCKSEQKGHDHKILDLMTRFDLFSVGTKFRPRRKLWDGKLRRCNATYLPKHEGRRPTKLDYVLVSNRWKSMAINSCVQWGASIHRFGETFDHGLLNVRWAWKLRAPKRTSRPDYQSMRQCDWAKFDDTLRAQ